MATDDPDNGWTRGAFLAVAAAAITGAAAPSPGLASEPPIRRLGGVVSPEAAELVRRQDTSQRALEVWASRSAPDIGEIRVSPPAAATGLPPEEFEVLPVAQPDVRGEWVRHRSADSRRRLLLFHGGGYVMGSPEGWRSAASLLSKAGDCSVFLARYRLGPEHPFPAAVDDGEAAYRFVRGAGPAGPAPAELLAIGGSSAGGGLAIAVSLKLREKGAPLPDAILALCPYVDATAPPSPTPEGRRVLEVFNAMYLADGDPRNPLVSPVYADLRGLPRLLVQAGGADFILEQQLRFAEKARLAGVDVTTEIWRGLPHVWQTAYPTVPEAGQALEHLAKFLADMR